MEGVFRRRKGVESRSHHRGRRMELLFNGDIEDSHKFEARGRHRPQRISYEFLVMVNLTVDFLLKCPWFLVCSNCTGHSSPKSNQRTGVRAPVRENRHERCGLTRSSRSQHVVTNSPMVVDARGDGRAGSRTECFSFQDGSGLWLGENRDRRTIKAGDHGSPG